MTEAYRTASAPTTQEVPDDSSDLRYCCLWHAGERIKSTARAHESSAGIRDSAEALPSSAPGGLEQVVWSMVPRGLRAGWGCMQPGCVCVRARILLAWACPNQHPQPPLEVWIFSLHRCTFISRLGHATKSSVPFFVARDGRRAAQLASNSSHRSQRTTKHRAKSRAWTRPSYGKYQRPRSRLTVRGMMQEIEAGASHREAPTTRA